MVYIMESEYSIGQFLYVWQEARQSIIAVRVIEEIIRTTTGGKTIEYLVFAEGFSESGSKFKVTNETQNVFASLVDLRRFLLARAEGAIDQMIEGVRPHEPQDNDNVKEDISS